MIKPQLSDIQKIVQKVFPRATVKKFEKTSLGCLNWVYIVDLDQKHEKLVAKIVYRKHRDERNVMQKEVEIIKTLNRRKIFGVPKLINFDNSKRDVPWTYLLESYLEGTPIAEIKNISQGNLTNIVDKLSQYITSIQKIKEKVITEFEENAPTYNSFTEYIKIRVPEYSKMCSGTTKIPRQLIRESCDIIMAGSKQIDDKKFVLCHSDVSAHNVLIKDGRLSGVVDYEAAQTLCPEFDLVTFYHCYLFNYPTAWQWLLKKYAERNPIPANFPERLKILMAYRSLRYLSRVAKYDLWEFLAGDIARMKEVVDGSFINTIRIKR